MMFMWIGMRKLAVVATLVGLGGTGAMLLAREGRNSATFPTPSHTWTGPLEVTEDKVPVVMVNSRRIRLNYELRELGPSGVSSVELWATRDGKTWQRYSDEPPPPGPLVIHVAEEGRYGFTLVVKSGVGIAGHRPTQGDKPQVWVEVDETKPSVRLTDVIIGRGSEHGQLEIRWSALDAHLLARPIAISISTNKDGPWSPIVSGLENTGRYVWKMPADVAYRFYVRVEATDLAGNVGTEQSLRPVEVDHAQPRGVILGVDVEKKDGTDIHDR